MDSFQDLKEKYRFHSQKQLERAKKANQQSKLSEIAHKSNVKLLALKKALKTKMDEKKKEKYEKRVLMYKIANEEEAADYEKFFDENESECELNEENSQVQPESDESQDAQQSDKENGSQENGNENSRDQLEDDSQPNRGEDVDECSNENETNSQSMDCTPGNLIEQNRDMLTRMINKTQPSQLDNEDLLGLCSAKVAARDFIDDECEDDDDDCSMQEEADSEGDSNDEEEDESQLDEEEESQLNEESNEAEKATADEEKEESNSGFDLVKDRLKRHRELESDSDDDYSFANKFKFKKTCKIQESDDEDDKRAGRPNSALSFKNKFSSQMTANEESNSNDNKLSSINGDDYENLNSQDSQFANNRESTFLESRPDVRKTRFNLNDFIEDQAELSDEDKDRVSSDEEEDSNDEYEQEEIVENLPSDEEILKANNKMFM